MKKIYIHYHNAKMLFAVFEIKNNTNHVNSIASFFSGAGILGKNEEEPVSVWMDIVKGNYYKGKIKIFYI